MAIKQRPSDSGRKTQEKVKGELSKPSADESKRLNVPVPPDLYQRMKHQAVAEDRSLAEITRELWQEYLQES